MFLHIGADVVIPLNSVIAIFDMEKTTISKDTKEFLKSDWKLFHDAIQEHRLTVLHDILPKYGICVA